MRRVSLQCVAILLLALLPTGASALLHPKRPGWTEQAGPGEVLLATVQAWRDQVLWLDARPEADYQKQHVPGALPLNEDHWEELLPAVLQAWYPDWRVVVYCSRRSCDTGQQVAERLKRETGWQEVYVLKGGWEAWQALADK